MLGGSAKDATAAFVALELVHNATLIHDDILDEDEYRRGKSSTPSKFGVKTAVITGDALLSLGLKYAASTGNPKIVEWLSDTSLKMVTGIKKQIDINGRTATPEEFLEVNYLKSGSLFEAAGALGALTAGGSKEDVLKLAKFGRLYGDAYQIKDDIADTENNGENEPRSDLENGDMTLPVIYALQSDKISDKEKELLTNKGTEEFGVSVKELLNKTGAYDRSRILINELLDEAKKILDQFDDCEAKMGILSLLNELRD
jgi:geranylgeranyl pyrophosphate synthase